MWRLFAVIVLGLFSGMGQTKDAAALPNVQLVAREITGGHSLPGAKAYAATLTSNDTKPVRVEVIQLPPEYGGGGAIVYPCSLQLWNSESRRWRTLPPNKLSDHGPNPQLSHTEIEPKEKVEVCRKMVLKEDIIGGKCGRFALSFAWHQKPAVFSDVFPISDPEHPDKVLQCSKLAN